MSDVPTQLLTDDASGALVERRYRLRVVAGPDQGKDHALDAGATAAISRAASEAGIDRNYIHRLVKKYGLEVDRG